jgi:hypothetical protein
MPQKSEIHAIWGTELVHLYQAETGQANCYDHANNHYRYKHPYEAEIAHHKFPESIFEARDPIKYQPVESTAATFVDTFEGVLEMLEELKKSTEIAIDTEHHDYRTYTGLLSLMQISTREKDWIIDTLQPWRHKLEVLNQVFADPSIVKVIHYEAAKRMILTSSIGSSRCLYGHHLVTAGLRPLHRRSVRHVRCRVFTWIPRKKLGIPFEKVRRL